MKTIQVNCWQEVKEALSSIESDRASMNEENNFSLKPPQFLYRGQGNSEWSLQTTLERAHPESISVSTYYRHILITRPQVEAFSDNRWELMGLEEYREWADSRSDLNWPDYPGYEYMIYLRHHGFPSPLMDWTMSSYVAAYFAYTNIPSDSESVAIYCYSETLGGGKSWSSDEPLITVRGPYARSHRRHFLQQCMYTVCSMLNEGSLYYTSHESVFERNNQIQDLLWKIEVPSSTAAEALRDLDSMNVNALSLMGSEDSLIQTLAARQYVHNNA